MHYASSILGGMVSRTLTFMGSGFMRACCALMLGTFALTFVSHNQAAQRDTPSKEYQPNPDESNKSNETSNNKSIIIPDVRGVNIDENIRLRRDLDEYTRTVDPAHVQIEERRRLMHKRLQERFAQIDRDGDGMISRDEALDGIPQLLRHFNNVDLNGDNQLSLDELEALQAKIMERQRTMTVRVEPTPDVDQPSKKKSNKDNPSRKPAL